MSAQSLDPICEFYTKHPFPPPIENLDRALDLYKDESVRRSEFHLLWPHREYRDDLEVLVAGCGTWQAAKYALVHPAAHVVAVDVSPTSLEHTEKLKEKYNLTNLEVRSQAIESLGESEQQFDHIICTGVLHHLADPEAGLRALRSVLKREGTMYLMVYAPHGRAGLHLMREYCRRLGIGTSPQEIAELITVLRMLPPYHPVLAAQGGSREFPSSDALADALLNPRDRAYSVPQLYEFLDRCGLVLGRWCWQAAYLPQCGAMAKTPHADRLAALPEQEQFAAMELWRGLMANHSFVARRNDAEDAGSNVRFEDDYESYVPIRLPWTMCVEESLPPGAAGILVNQTHVFQDLFVMVGEQEKRMYKAIDGHRSIAEIAESVKEEDADPPVARHFFERLWRYDQVVFDTTKAK